MNAELLRYAIRRSHWTPKSNGQAQPQPQPQLEPQLEPQLGQLNHLLEILEKFGKRVEILENIISPLNLKIETIKQVVADYYGLTIAELNSHQQGKNVTRRRQIAIYLCLRFTGSSLPTVAWYFGDRDHTTILHARDVVAERRQNDQEIDRQITELEQKLKAQNAPQS